MFLTLMLVGILGHAGMAQTYVDGDRYRVGLQAGPVVSLLTGTELTKGSANYGFTAAIYYKYRLAKGFHFQTAMGPTVRGSRFSGNGPTGYNRFTLLYLDATELVLIDLNRDKHEHSLVMGLQPSVLLQSWVYSPYFQMSPAARGVKLNGGDLFVVAGYQFHRKVFGIQSVVKVGLTNINRGLNMYDVLGKPLGPQGPGNGTIRNISWETCITF